MNQARSLVHVYTDGCVAVSTGAVEMGQGVNTKIAQVAATFSALPIEQVKVHTTNTLRIANTSPTAASAAADLNGKATQIACETIRDRLLEVAKDLVEAESIERLSLEERLCLSQRRTHRARLANACHGRSSADVLTSASMRITRRPGINFDWSTAKGHPFAYHVYGTAIVGVTVDCLRGRYEVDYVKCCHDFGSSMNTAVDYGQIEGGIVQGLGWMTMEEVVYDDERQAAIERSVDL